MPTWRAVKNCEDFFVLGHVVKKQYLCSVFRKKVNKEKVTKKKI